ncbi:tyrosine-type recombinase/integrase [Dulcicalothrix desertica]|nr:tyrosine-type recombinase/integrase [Dulcicalothrix desertica]TWH61603.1 type 1 fimbriae regulatory protein FimB/type 1 fimbriae regulatory protein FimE [Dulcicalothrix desertica PCC 7102]
MLVRRKNKDYRSREHLTVGEVNQLLEIAKVYGRHKVRNYALVLLMFRHGLRVSEACELRWDAISLIDGEIFITRKKGSESGTHPLPEDEIEALGRLRSSNPNNDYVFVGERGEVLTPAAVQRLLSRLGKLAGLTIKVHPHQLRHACGYYLVNAGYSTRTIQDFLGHRDIRHTERYTKLNSKRFSNIDWNKGKEQPF